jgi:hypothetical protein
METSIYLKKIIERNFYLGYALFGWVGVLWGFVPTSLIRIQGHAAYPAPLVLHAHAALFTGWMVLLTTQVLLVRGGNLALHRSLGMLGFAMVPLMFATGLVAEFYDMNLALARAGVHSERERRFLAIPLFDMIAFPMLTLLGLALRRDPAAHKRLMYLGTVPLVAAAWARATNRIIVGALGLEQGPLRIFVGYFGIGCALLLVLAAFDHWSRGGQHRVTVIGASLLAGAMVLTSFVYWSPWWPSVAVGMARLAAG